MIILDTNIVSELMKDEANPRVLAWMDRHDEASLYTSSISHAEILYGIAILPAGRKKDALTSAAIGMFERYFIKRVLPFDSASATAFAEIASLRRAQGRPISMADAQISAIARSTGAILATRNVLDFDNCGVEIVDPWRLGA